MDRDDGRKSEIYRWIKIGGLLSFLPFVLVAGPLAGFYIGHYLESRFCLSSWTTLILITAGFIGSLVEAVRIVRFALRAQEKV